MRASLGKPLNFFRDAASRKGQHVAASRNNLGVMLARLGFLKEAEKEFVIALKQSNGVFDDAAHNLKLCRSLMLVQEYSLTVTNISDRNRWRTDAHLSLLRIRCNLRHSVPL